MSDDERMDRAERIKQLRQGRRGGQSEDESDDANRSSSTEQTDNGTAEAVDGDQPGPDSTINDEESSADEAGPGASTTTASDGADDATAKASTAADDVSTDTGDENEGSGPSDGDDAKPDESNDSEPSEDDEALSAAKAAAQAATEFEGKDVAEIEPGEGSETDTEAAAPAGATIAGAEVEETTAEETRVLEFRLGGERYCLDIEYVEEIVREESVTRVPNTPEYVEGVVDLRGQITTILDPTVAADIETDNDDRLIVVFDADTFDDYGEIGWSVDAVDQVSLIAETDVKDPPMDEPYINGVIERGEEFVIWTTPELALDVTEEE